MDKQVSLTPDGGVLKTILVEGSGSLPKSNQEVAILYTGKLEDGKVFDTSGHSAFKFILGVGDVIRGWDIGVATMRRGEKARFIVTSQYGYGDTGSPPNVPPKATLHMEIELLDFHDKRRAIKDMDNDEKEKYAEDHKAQGNEGFKANKLAYAVYAYHEGLSAVEQIMEAERTDAIWTLWKSLQLNYCVCQNKLGNWAQVKKHADKVLEKDNKNVKAHYLRGKAEKCLGQFAAAIHDLTSALESCPSDAEVLRELEDAKAKRKLQQDKEKQLCQKMFNAGSISSPMVSGKPKMIPYDASNTRVFLDIQIGLTTARKVIVELFANTPKTCENFRCLCTGERSTEQQSLHYKGTRFNRLLKGLLMQGGDVTAGKGCASIYGKQFDDENFEYAHSQRGLLSMANTGPNSNGSQFLITFAPAPSLDHKHVVFGRIIQGMNVLRDVEQVPTDSHDVSSVLGVC